MPNNKNTVWCDITTQNNMSKLFCEMDNQTVDNFKFVIDNLYLNYTKSQVLNFISNLYDHADDIFNEK